MIMVIEAIVILTCIIGIGAAIVLLLKLRTIEQQSRIAQKEFEQRFDREVRRE